MKAQEIIAHVEEMRKLKGIHKNSLCGKAEIKPTFYYLLLTGQRSASLEVASKLCQEVGLKLIVASDLA